jgi:hypothetical protein
MPAPAMFETKLKKNKKNRLINSARIELNKGIFF